MQNLARAVMLLTAAIVVLACGGPVATAAGPLVTVEVRGGLCADGPCGMTVVLDRDGRVHQAAKPPNDLGTVPADLLRTLDVLVRTTDFAAIKSRPFTGECPTAFDGQEFVFEFVAPGGVWRIATCETAVDFGLPLFVAVSTALGPYMALPAT